MMCRAEVTGSFVPTVAKQIQSVEPGERVGCWGGGGGGRLDHKAANLLAGHRVKPRRNQLSGASRTPAGMIPMRSEQAMSVCSGLLTSTPPSRCVRHTKPCTSSLNMPSPPTHTTLTTGRRALAAGASAAAVATLLTHPSYFFSSASSLRWSRAWLAYSVTRIRPAMRTHVRRV